MKGTAVVAPTVPAPPEQALRRGNQGVMRMIALSWGIRRAIIAAQCEEGLPSMLEHANMIEEQLEQHGPDEPTVRPSPTDDGFLRSSTWARWQLGIPLPAGPEGVPVTSSLCGMEFANA